MTTLNPAPWPNSQRIAEPAYQPGTLCEALFASKLQSSQHPSARDVRAVITNTLRTLDVAECVAQVAQEFGDHPETATVRMQWAIDAVAAAYNCAPADESARPSRSAGNHDGSAGSRTVHHRGTVTTDSAPALA